ncbi:MAG: hypothetical protein FWG64_06310 [Firmicutes bacterium]|nr:hypothetical protein [Bacillota bacterium]
MSYDKFIKLKGFTLRNQNLFDVKQSSLYANTKEDERMYLVDFIRYVETNNCLCFLDIKNFEESMNSFPIPNQPNKKNDKIVNQSTYKTCQKFLYSLNTYSSILTRKKNEQPVNLINESIDKNVRNLREKAIKDLRENTVNKLPKEKINVNDLEKINKKTEVHIVFITLLKDYPIDNCKKIRDKISDMLPSYINDIWRPHVEVKDRLIQIFH